MCRRVAGGFDLRGGEAVEGIDAEEVGAAVEARDAQSAKVVGVERGQEGGLHGVLQWLRPPVVQLNHPPCRRP